MNKKMKRYALLGLVIVSLCGCKNPRLLKYIKTANGYKYYKFEMAAGETTLNTEDGENFRMIALEQWLIEEEPNGTMEYEIVSRRADLLGKFSPNDSENVYLVYYVFKVKQHETQ